MIDVALLDDIYATGVAPDRWPAFLGRLARLHGARYGGMLAASWWHANFVMVPGHGGSLRHIDDRWRLPGPRDPDPIMERSHLFRSDYDACLLESLAGTGNYDAMPPFAGHASGVRTFIRGRSGRVLMLTLNGFPSEADARKVLPRLDLLRPHLARAADLTTSLAEAKAQAAVDSLDFAGTPAAILTSDGYVRAANARFTASIRDRATISERRLRFRRPDINARIDAARAASRREQMLGRSIALPAHGDLEACVLHLLPLRNELARAFFDSDDFVLIAADPGNRMVPKAGLVRLLFDLTPAEAMLAIELASGHSLQEAAVTRGIAYATARVHLRSIFAKTGCSRQSELVALLHVPGLAVGTDPHRFTD